MTRFLSWRNPMPRSLMLLAISFMFAVGPTVQASSPQALLVEAGVLFQRAEAMEGEEQRALLSETFDLLLRIVTDYPDSPIAAQLRGGGVALVGGPPLSLNVLASRVEENCKRMPTLDCVLEMAGMYALATPEGKDDRLSSVARVLWQAGRIEESFTSFGYMADGQHQAMMDLLWEEYHAERFSEARQLWEKIHYLNEKAPRFETRTMENILLQIEVLRQIDEGDTEGALKAIQAMGLPSPRDELLEKIALLHAEAGAYGKARSVARSISGEFSLEPVLRKLTEIFAGQGNLEEAKATALSIGEPFQFGQALLAIASAQAASGYKYQAQETLVEVREVLEDTSRNRDFLVGQYFVVYAEYDFWDDAKLWENVLSHLEILNDKSASSFLEGLASQLAMAGKRSAAKRCYDTALEKHQKLFAEPGDHRTYKDSLYRIIFSQAEVGMIEEAYETFQAVSSEIQVADTLQLLVPHAAERARVALLMAVRSGSDEVRLDLMNEVRMQAEKDIGVALKIFHEAEFRGKQLASTDIASAVSLLSNVALANTKIGIHGNRAFPEALKAARIESRPYFRAFFLTVVAGAQVDAGLKEEGLETIKEALGTFGEIQRLEERFRILMGVVNLFIKVDDQLDAAS